MVNAILLEEGYARVDIYPPDVRYLKQFVDLQQQARKAGRGRWSACQP